MLGYKQSSSPDADHKYLLNNSTVPGPILQFLPSALKYKLMFIFPFPDTYNFWNSCFNFLSKWIF